MDTIAVTVPTQALKLGHTLYLPHYTRPGQYVAPGHFEGISPTFYKSTLLAQGAKVVTEMLLTRTWKEKY